MNPLMCRTGMRKPSDDSGPSGLEVGSTSSCQHARLSLQLRIGFGLFADEAFLQVLRPEAVLHGPLPKRFEQGVTFRS